MFSIHLVRTLIGLINLTLGMMWGSQLVNALDVKTCFKALCEANVIGVLRYLRKSRSFQPSSTWQPLLDDAFEKISAVAKSWDDA